MKRITIIVLLSLIASSFQRSTVEHDHYIAAVVEYEVQSNADHNLENYLKLIRDAASQAADIVVFPEMTLTRGVSVRVPIADELLQYPVPALHPNLYDRVLVSLSQAARQLEIYIVVNLEETMDCVRDTNEFCPEKKHYSFNTNVIFDRNGAVIDRYRKINLFGEYTRSPALTPELGVFSTDFGVSFGHFICFDLMFQVPAVQVVEQYNLTDVIFPTMWFSELPFLTAVEIQEAYAYAKNINLLAAGANNVLVGSAGSGIFSGKSGALVSVMPGTPTTRVLVSKVPKVPGNIAPGTYPGPIYDDPAVQDRILIKKDPSLTAHISRLLEPGSQEFDLVDKDVACKFRVKFNYRNAEKKPYLRAFVYNGINVYAKRSIGVAYCVVVSCEDDKPSSCPYRYDTKRTNYEIEELSIQMNTIGPIYNSSLKCNDVLYYSTTVKTDKFPLDVSNYTFSSEESDKIRDKILEKREREKLSLTLKRPQKDLVSFGIWGRIYNMDGIDNSDTTVDDVKEYIEIENLIYNSNNSIK